MTRRLVPVAITAALVVAAASRDLGGQAPPPSTSTSQTSGSTQRAGRGSDAEPRIEILPVQGNVYMLAGAGGNITASVGRDGVLLVDAGRAESANAVMAALVQLQTTVSAAVQPNRCLGLHCPGTPYGWVSPTLNAVIASPAPPKPIRYIINTTIDADHVGGNETLSTLPRDSKIVGVTFPPVSVAPSAVIVAHEKVLLRMSEPAEGDPKLPSRAWPTVTYHDKQYKLSQFFNGEGIVMYGRAAHTDGDTFVFFRYSDVISAGDILDSTRYPRVDLARGGSLQGVLDGLNHILEIAVPEFRAQGGTLIVPGHGRLMDTGDVANYRNMVAIVRDRIADLIARGQTLAQVKAARPTLDYDGLYGSTTGSWTTDQFVEAAYRSLGGK